MLIGTLTGSWSSGHMLNASGHCESFFFCRWVRRGGRPSGVEATPSNSAQFQATIATKSISKVFAYVLVQCEGFVLDCWLLPG
jgi:hypothetical protein